MMEGKDRIDASLSEFPWRDMKRRPKEPDDISQEFSPVHRADGYLSASPRSSRQSQLRGLSEEKAKEDASSCDIE